MIDLFIQFDVLCNEVAHLRMILCNDEQKSRRYSLLLFQRRDEKDLLDPLILAESFQQYRSTMMEFLNQPSSRKNMGPCVICGAKGSEGRFRKLTEDAQGKALEYGTFDPTWELNVMQFCQSHYMSHMMHGTKSSEGRGSSKRRWEAIQDDVMEPSDYPEVLTETPEVSEEGRINEIDFIECVRSMAGIFYEREKKERMPPIYDWMLLREDLDAISQLA